MTTTTESLVRKRAAGAARGRWLMLIVLLAGQFLALLDVTIVNVAMPTIGRTLHATGAELQLVVAGYTVSYAMALITGARMGDLYGRRRMFLVGVLVFSVRPGARAGRWICRPAGAFVPEVPYVARGGFGGRERPG
jgi:MFS family permease